MMTKIEDRLTVLQPERLRNLRRTDQTIVPRVKLHSAFSPVDPIELPEPLRESTFTHVGVALVTALSHVCVLFLTTS
jgi:hypothetical protein